MLILLRLDIHVYMGVSMCVCYGVLCACVCVCLSIRRLVIDGLSVSHIFIVLGETTRVCHIAYSICL